MKLKTIVFTTCLSATMLFSFSALAEPPKGNPPPADQPGHPPQPEQDEARPHHGGRHGKHNPEERIAHLKEKLNLTSEQETKIRDIFKAEGDKMREEREANKGNRPNPDERRKKMEERRERVDAAIKGVLTPEQQTKWEEMKKKREERKRDRGKDIPKH